MRILVGCNKTTMGALVVRGTVRVGQHLRVTSESCTGIGRIARMEVNHSDAQVAHAGQNVALKLDDWADGGIDASRDCLIEAIAYI